MKPGFPSKVLITGGHEIGGVRSFAEGLRAGFTELGIPVEIVSPSRILLLWRELRDPRILKILSTSAVFAAPFARRAICMAHGVPQAISQGLLRMLSIIGSYKLANVSSRAQLVSVSHYTAASLWAIFKVSSDAVIHNPVKRLYLEPDCGLPSERCYVTYVGRLSVAKNLHHILPAVRDLLDENPGLRMCVIGEGEERTRLEAMIDGDARFEFKGAPDDVSVRDWLRRTRIFVSGNVAEGFGITYLEALAQGCIVAMPASGGGLEISPENVGRSVQLFPLSLSRSEVLATLRRALSASWRPVDTTSFTAKAVAEAYLAVDAGISAQGKIQAGACQ
jgi:glycosyltransferase involved in cell wall biosynthesis